LIVFDAGGTLLHGRKPSRRRRLSARSPLPAERVKRYVHANLLTVPASAFTDEFVTRVCRDLQIAVEDFPYRPGSDRYTLDTWARTAVQYLAAYAPAAVLSNVSAFDTDLKNTLVTGLGELLTHVHVSYELGLAKPNPEAFRACADAAGVAMSDLVVLGNDLHNDVLGAIRTGAKAGWLNPAGHPLPDLDATTASRLVIASSLMHLVTQVEQRWFTPRPQVSQPEA
jgi:FMN phosphatase YigB (HAD superfamily)